MMTRACGCSQETNLNPGVSENACKYAVKTNVPTGVYSGAREFVFRPQALMITYHYYQPNFEYAYFC